MTILTCYTPEFEEFFGALLTLKRRIESPPIGLGNIDLYTRTAFESAARNQYLRRGDLETLEFVIFRECCSRFNQLPMTVRWRDEVTAGPASADGLTLGALYESRDIFEDALLVACYLQSVQEGDSSRRARQSDLESIPVLLDLYQLASQIARSAEPFVPRVLSTEVERAIELYTRREDLLAQLRSTSLDKAEVDTGEEGKRKREGARAELRKEAVSLKQELEKARRNRRY